ncbi:MAG: PAS domain S-box protein [Proteobacteria bacterium]|nr:PAS domain S-box protein [Pseudomonadota bacterium]
MDASLQAESEGSASGRIARRSVLILAALLVCLLVLGYALTIWRVHSEAVDQAAHASANLANLLDEHAQRTFRVIEVTLEGVVGTLRSELARQPLDAERIASILEERKRAASEVQNILYLDPTGSAVSDALGRTSPLDLSDRPYFFAHRNKPDLGVFVSEPGESRAGRGRTVVLSRRLSAADGRFLGVIAASVSARYFETFYGTVDVGPNGVVALRSRMGAVAARYPIVESVIVGTAPPDPRVPAAVASGLGHGTLDFVNQVDGVRRIVSFRTVADSPFVVAVGLAYADFLAAWRTEVVTYGLATLLLSVAAAAFTAALLRQMAAREKAHALIQESQQEAAAAHARLLDAIEALPAGFVIFDPDERVIMANARHGEMLPAAGRAAAGTTLESLVRREGELQKDAGAAERSVDWARGRLTAIRRGDVDFETQLFNGRWIREIDRRTAEGGIVSIRLDVTRSKNAEEAVRRSELRERQARERLETILNRVPVGCIVTDAEFRYTYWNPAAEKIFGYRFEEVQGRLPYDTVIAAESAEAVKARHARLRDGDMTANGTAVHVTKDGRRRIAEWYNTPLFGADGAFLGIIAMGIDITERTQTEQALRQLLKMEAIGHLTGGIAHDFNNLLTVVMGNAEILVERAAGRPELLPLAETIRNAAERGAALTHRLLAFARLQPLNPAAIDLNELVRGMETIIRRSIGEDIDVELGLAADLRQAFADASQVESALLNLVVNARHAMPGGGRLTIETGNVTLDADYALGEPEVDPGAYAMLAVTDTGIGMAPDVVRRAFEPFFTTKDVGQGSGLGLSMVFGFAKQSKGHVKIYSELGQGTTVKLYLPQAAASGAVEVDAGGAITQSPRGSETILAVEDDAFVRGYVVQQLHSLGYQVAEASDAPDALEILRQREDIVLLFTDVILPKGMNGRELADAARRLRPQLRVLYTSGYTENAILHQGRLDPHVHLLTKPYRKADLARKIRAVLDEAP